MNATSLDRVWTSLRQRPGTISLTGFLLALFLVELLVLNVSGEQTAQWWFYLRKPTTWPFVPITPGIVFSPLSHQLHDLTHIISNVVMLLAIGWFAEPSLGTRKLVGLTIGGAYVGMVLGIFLAPLFRMWMVAGMSGGILTLLAYSGFTLRESIDAKVFGSVPDYKWGWVGEYGYVALSVFFVLLLYELLVTGNMGHTLGLLIGYAYFMFDREKIRNNPGSRATN